MRRADRYDDSFIFERKPFHVARERHPRGLDRAERRSVAVRLTRGAGHLPQRPEHRARCRQLRLAGIRAASRIVAHRRRARRRRSQGDGRAELRRGRNAPESRRGNERRGWEFMGHGITNSENLAGLDPDKERALIQNVLKTIEQSTGRRPRGWLGPGLTETHNTLDILAEEGVNYCGDWNSDDQPYPMKVRKGRMFSIPYCMEINDIPLFIRKGYTGEQYLQSVVDQFDTLYADSAKQPRVLGMPLHPMIIGQPLRSKYLERALAHMKKHERVWFATGSEIIDAYQRAT